eukprot:111363-Hanusia_phi.AAC.4
MPDRPQPSGEEGESTEEDEKESEHEEDDTEEEEESEIQGSEGENSGGNEPESEPVTEDRSNAVAGTTKGREENAGEKAQGDIQREVNINTNKESDVQQGNVAAITDISSMRSIQTNTVQAEVHDEEETPVDDEYGLCILDRSGTGSTAFRERQKLKLLDDFLESAEGYFAPPDINDYPIQALNPSLQKKNPMVFLEFSSDETLLGKLVFEIFENIVPRTANNFVSLCCGDPSKDELSFQKCRVHSIIEDFMLVSGDVTNGDGTGGKSIYGETFPDESFELCHVGPGRTNYHVTHTGSHLEISETSKHD